MIEYESLIKPLIADDPCGGDIRKNTEMQEEYLKLKELRNELRREERKNIEIDNNLTINRNDWQQVVDIASNILSKHSKDVEIAVWLIEALTRTDQFAGLTVSFDVLSYFFEHYKEQLNPLPGEGQEDEEYHPQLAPISMLGGKYEMGTIIAPIYFCELIKTNSGETFNAWELKKILKSGNKSQTNQEVNKDEILRSEPVKKAVDNIDKEQFFIVEDQVASCLESFARLNSQLTLNFERMAPNLVNLNNALTYCLSIVASISKIVTVPSIQQTVKDNIPEKELELEPVNSLSIDNLNHKALDNETSVKLLSVLTEFFRESQPHSPISYSLERAVRWSKMSLPQILNEMIPNEKAYSEYCKISGIMIEEEEENEDGDDE